MQIGLLVKGAIIGFSIAAPVGPIGVLCIRRTLSDGQPYGLVSGLGAATADALYGLMAAFGLVLITDVLVDQQLWLRTIGGAFLCYLGVRAFLSDAAAEEAKAWGKGLLGAYFSTLLLTLTNPMTILAFVAILAGAGVTEGSVGVAAVFVLGVFLGSALWWLTLSVAVGLLRGRLNAGVMRWANRISGVMIFGFGIVALVGAFAGG